MKNLLSHILFFLLCFGSFANTPSNTKIVSLNGISFYEHTVEKKETLYELSKKYNVSQETILRYNSNALDGLKEGMVIKIPKDQTIKKDDILSDENLIKHVVKKGETIYSLSNVYGISQNDLLQQNPELVNGLKIGQEIIIKKNSENKRFLKHIVKRKETLYGISKDFNLSISEIEKYNPYIKNGLKMGDTLQIPLFKEQDESVSVPKQTKNLSQSSLNSETHGLEKTKEIAFAEQNTKRTVHVSLLLPLMLDNLSNQDETINKFTDFYAGILMGIRELKSHGYNVNINIYDTEKSANKIYEILTDPMIAKSDLIIGPAYGLQIKPIADFAKKHEIPVVIPFSKKVAEIDNNPFIFQFNANVKYSFSIMAALFEKQFYNKNLVFVQYSQTDDFSVYLQQYLTNKKIHFQQIKAADLSSFNPSSSKNNLLILCTKNAKEAVTSIEETQSWNASLTPVSLFVSEDLGEPILSAYDIYFFSPFYISLSGKNYQKYQDYFQSNFSPALTNNPRFDLLGHDISVYFIKNISHKGKSFVIPKDESEQQLQSMLAFRRVNPNGGFVNEGCFLLHSKNGSVSRIK